MTRRIIHIAQTDSTNRYLHDIMTEGEDMTVVVTDYQTAGRGQGSNSWESEEGKNLLMSIRVRPTMVPPRNQFILSEAGALAVGKALAAYADGISLKWPNDIYWNDKKISGTLIETTVSGLALATCTFGIGINVNQQVFHSDAPNPVSLYQILGHEVPVEEVMYHVLDALESELSLIWTGDSRSVTDRYHQHLYRRQGFHPYSDAQGPFMAELLHVEDDGHLVLRDTTGLIRQYAFKEVAYMINQL